MKIYNVKMNKAEMARVRPQLVLRDQLGILPNVEPLPPFQEPLVQKLKKNGRQFRSAADRQPDHFFSFI